MRLPLQFLALVPKPAQSHATGFGGLHGCFGALANHQPLFLGKRRVDVQHERVGIGPKLGNNERHTMLQPIELGDDDVSLRLFGALDGLYQLGSVILAAALDFRQGFQEGEAIGLGKPL